MSEKISPDLDFHYKPKIVFDVFDSRAKIPYQQTAQKEMQLPIENHFRSGSVPLLDPKEVANVYNMMKKDNVGANRFN